MDEQKTRVLLVDDHTLFREGVASIIGTQPDFEIIGEAQDGLEAQIKEKEELINGLNTENSSLRELNTSFSKLIK